MIKKISFLSGALGVRITTEAKKLGWKADDRVKIKVVEDTIVITKVPEGYEEE